MQFEIEMTFRQPFFRVFERSPGSAVPDGHRAAAIFSFRNRTFEITVVQRMIFDINGEALLTGNKAWAFCERPAFQNAIQFETEIVMQPSRIVLLNNEVVPFCLRTLS